MPATGVPSLDVIGFVRTGGLEPPRPKTLDPKSNAATNYATGANVPQRYDFFLNCRPLCDGV